MKRHNKINQDKLTIQINSYSNYIENYLNSQPSYNAGISRTNIAETLTADNFNENLVKGKIKFLTKIRRLFKWPIRLSIAAFSVIGMVFTAVFIGMHFGVFNVQGSIQQRNIFYGTLKKLTPSPKILAQQMNTSSAKLSCSQYSGNCAWINSPQWAVVEAGLEKDKQVINQAAAATGVSPMMIVACVAPEQIRLFTSEREIFESYFQPLKILGSMTDFSLGVAGVKQATANLIEQYAQNPSSPFYPGANYSNLITYPANVSHSALQYDRLTSSNHYYDYLYVGLFIKEIESQWLKDGYNINQRPDVITTLYNIGFSYSIPKADPQAGGSTITVNDQAYSFGELGTLIYNSGILASSFSTQAS